MNRWIKGFLITVLCISSLIAFGCGKSQPKQDDLNRVIKIGVTAGPHADVVDMVAREAKKMNINIRIIEFRDYVNPDKALASGDIDLNSYQHAPFLSNFNKQNGSDLVPIGKTILMRMGIYSDQVRNVKSLRDGAVVAIPNDPTNGGRGLLLLEKAGVIKLKDGIGFKATVQDVVANPKHLQFKKMETAQLPRSLAEVDAAAITMNYAMSTGLNIKKQCIFLEDKNEPLAIMILAAKAENKDNPTYKKIADLFHSAAVKKAIEEEYNGTIIPAE